MAILGRDFFILKTMMFHEVTTVLNERKHLKMVIRSVPDAVSLILGRTEWLGLTALHRALLVDLTLHRTQFVSFNTRATDWLQQDAQQPQPLF